MSTDQWIVNLPKNVLYRKEVTLSKQNNKPIHTEKSIRKWNEMESVVEDGNLTKLHV